MTTETIIVAVVFAAIIIFVCEISIRVKRKADENQTISFRETLELTEAPVITFRTRGNDGKDIKLNLLIDTGATDSFFDKSLLPKIHPSVMNKTKSSYEITTAAGTVNASEVISLQFNYDFSTFVETFMILDLTETNDYCKKEHGYTLAGVLGNTFFKATETIIDYEKLKLNIKKNGKCNKIAESGK